MRIRAINKFDRHFVLESKTAIKLKCKLQNARFAFRPKKIKIKIKQKQSSPHEKKIIRRRGKKMNLKEENDQFKKELTKKKQPKTKKL